MGGVGAYHGYHNGPAGEGEWWIPGWGAGRNLGAAIRGGNGRAAAGNGAILVLEAAGGGLAAGAAVRLAPAARTLIVAGWRWIFGAGAGAGSGLGIDRLSGMDRRIFETAMEFARTRAPQFPTLSRFYQHVMHLGNAVRHHISNGQVHHIGTYRGQEVWGSLVTRVGIVELNGATWIVRQRPNGTWELLGAFLP